MHDQNERFKTYANRSSSSKAEEAASDLALITTMLLRGDDAEGIASDLKSIVGPNDVLH